MKAVVIRGLAALVSLKTWVCRPFAALAEFNRQQLRLTRVQYSQDAYMNRPGAPDTYSEFLFRTRGPLRHEPSARARLDGHPIH
jgi:hypothetical protein